MAAKSNDVKVVSLNSNAVLGESNNGVSDITVSDLGSETISRNSSNAGISSDGARVLEEPNVIVGESNRATRNRVVELMSCYDGPRFMGLMNLVKRVLDGNVDKEVEYENREGINLVVDLNACRGANGELTSGVGDEGTASDKDLVANELVTDGMLAVEEIINAEDGVLTPNELVQFLGTLAEAPHRETDESQFAIVKEQLLAFNRWKGRHQLPAYVEHVGLLEDDAQEATEGVIPGPCKRKHPSSDDERPKKKEKLLSVLLTSSSRLQNGDKKSVERRRKNKSMS